MCIIRPSINDVLQPSEVFPRAVSALALILKEVSIIEELVIKLDRPEVVTAAIIMRILISYDDPVGVRIVLRR